MQFLGDRPGKFRNEVLVISLVSAVSCLISLLFFFLALDVSYLVKLFFWFLLSVSLFHVIFALYSSLRGVHVRLIDFPYLLIVAIGIFILTVHSSEQREAYLDKYNDFFLRQIERQHIEQLWPALKTYKQFACINAEEIVLLKLHCAFAGEVEKIASDSTPISERIEILSRVRVLFQRISQEDDKRFSGAFDILVQMEGKSPSDQKALREKYAEFSRVNTFGTYEQVKTHFNIIERDIRARAEEAQRTRAEDGILRILFVVGYTAIWPFVFLFALALRLTKVTMEVLAWGQP